MHAEISGRRPVARASSVGLPPASKLRLAGLTALACLAGTGAVTSCSATTSAAGPKYEVQASTIGGLGKIIADGAGFTLYMYVPDHQGLSRCSGTCAAQWPPLVLPPGVTRPKAGQGISAALLGTIRRQNGSLQVTYDRWPLYLWQGDTAAGQVTGQAHNGDLWYVVSVTGSVDRGTPSG